MKNKKLSGPAVFMYTVILFTAILSFLCFATYYSGKHNSNAILWTGIVSFMILYHFGLRILMGEITKLFSVDYKHPLFKKRFFEPSLYQMLHVRKWKDKVLTFDPESFNFRARTLSQLATTMAKSELDHWINEIISLTSIFFCFLWGHPFIFICTAVLAMLFDAQFIVVQRYNRPIVLKLMEMKIARDAKKNNTKNGEIIK